MTRTNIRINLYPKNYTNEYPNKYSDQKYLHSQFHRCPQIISWIILWMHSSVQQQSGGVCKQIKQELCTKSFGSHNIIMFVQYVENYSVVSSWPNPKIFSWLCNDQCETWGRALFWSPDENLFGNVLYEENLLPSMKRTFMI